MSEPLTIKKELFTSEQKKNKYDNIFDVIPDHVWKDSLDLFEGNSDHNMKFIFEDYIIYFRKELLPIGANKFLTKDDEIIITSKMCTNYISFIMLLFRLIGKFRFKDVIYNETDNIKLLIYTWEISDYFTKFTQLYQVKNFNSRIIFSKERIDPLMILLNYRWLKFEEDDILPPNMEKAYMVPMYGKERYKEEDLVKSYITYDEYLSECS